MKDLIGSLLVILIAFMCLLISEVIPQGLINFVILMCLANIMLKEVKK